MKNKMEKEELKVRVKKGATAIGNYIYKHRDTIMAVVMFVVLVTPKIVFADENSGGDDGTWTFIINLMKTWGKRIGGAVALFGGIEFGLGWKDNNPADKQQGLKILIGGIIVRTVCNNADSFLN